MATMTEIAMLHDVSKCTACRGCMVACKQWKNLPADMSPFEGNYQSHEDLSPSTYNLIKMKETYENGNFRWDFLKFQCMHCGIPACAKACPEEALVKQANGVVSFIEDRCVGCGYCETNCTFDVPRIDAVRKKSTKCNLCEDRIANGMVPSCAQTCTADAILFGTREEMTEIAKARVQVLKEQYPNAQLYGVDKNDGIGGTNMMYILTDRPSVFGLPENPKVSTSLTIWKDYAQPAGKFLFGAAAMVVAGALVNNAMIGKKNKGGHDHEQNQ